MDKREFFQRLQREVAALDEGGLKNALDYAVRRAMTLEQRAPFNDGDVVRAHIEKHLRSGASALSGGMLKKAQEAVARAAEDSALRDKLVEAVPGPDSNPNRRITPVPDAPGNERVALRCESCPAEVFFEERDGREIWNCTEHTDQPEHWGYMQEKH